MNVHDTLVAARAVIAKPENWTINALARDKHNEPTHANADDAVCFCAAGAIRKAVGSIDMNVIEALEEVLLDRGQDPNVPTFNDRSTHAEVLALFDAAIEKTRGS